MRTENSVFLFSDADKQLFDSTGVSGNSILMPEKIDYEMGFGKSRTALCIRGLTQAGLEHFVAEYGRSYRTLYLNDCRMIEDFSPLGELEGLEALRIEWCRGTDRLWDMSGNKALRIISIAEARRIIHDPALLATSGSLEEIRLWGGEHYALASLECFRGIRTLRRIDLNNISLENKSLEVLDILPALEEFHFDPGMLATEEIVRICAKYPELYGRSLQAYTDETVGIYDVRVCGARKPGLYLPKDQKRLDKYVEAINKLVAEYSRTT